MLGDHFYHQRIRRAVAVFGSLFNDINVVRKDSAGNQMSALRVPLSYAPKRDFFARIDAIISSRFLAVFPLAGRSKSMLEI